MASKSNTVWLLYGNGVDSASAFTPIPGDPIQSKSLGPRLKEEIEKAGFTVKFTQDAREVRGDLFALISWDAHPVILQNLACCPKERCFLVAFEPPMICPGYYSREAQSQFGKIFIWFDDLVDDVHFYKIHCPFNQWDRGIPQDLPPFSQKKLCCLMNGNKWWGNDPNELNSERIKAINALTPTGEFDLYGSGWHGVSSWKGVAQEDASSVFKQYKFSIRYENYGNRPGYVGDKIFPALLGRTVPIYLGASNIEKYIPKECFIDKREFLSYEELYHFMKNMDEKTHEGYLAAGLDYIQSPKKDLFTTEDAVERLMKQLLSLS